MRKIICFLFSLLFCINFAHQNAQAQGYAPEMFGVGEVIVNFAQFDDPKVANSCGLSREKIADLFDNVFKKTDVPAVAVVDARPPISGIARIQLIPQISSYEDQNLDCISWVSLSAESHNNVVIPPVDAPRSVTAVYWRQHAKVFSSQAIHAQKVEEVLKKLAEQFAQQYRIDQPPSILQK